MTVDILTVENVSKLFPPKTVALENVSLRVRAGEVHCLVGANGAGKSTLLKLVAGAMRPNQGRILLEGQEIRPKTPAEATRYGISMIFQELDLIPHLTVEQNLFLGHVPSSKGIVRRIERRRRSLDALERIGAHFRPADLVADLSLADQQLTAIARSLTMGAKLIIMDEPSAALNEPEVERVFSVIRGLTRDLVSVIYVSHRLGEVMEIGDRVTVLRGGKSVATFDLDNTKEQSLIDAMLGEQRILVEREERPRLNGAEAIHVHHLQAEGGLEVRDFSVRSGEIAGLAGLSGSGRTQFLRALFGADPSSGSIKLGEQDYSPSGPGDAVQMGFGLVPKDRKGDGLALKAAIYKNVALPSLAGKRIVRKSVELKRAGAVLRRLSAKHSGLEQPAIQLSGGNQQKVVLAKWVLSGARVLLLNEPSRGLDLGAKADLYKLVKELADAGAAVIIASSELEELYAVCDSIWVFREGHNIARYLPDETSTEVILEVVIGGKSA